MAEFINTIDVLGDDAVIDSIINRTITEFKDDKITQIQNAAFYGCAELVNIAFPNVTTMGIHVDNTIHGAFQKCTALTEVTDAQFPLLTNLTARAFAECTALTKVSLSNVTDLSWQALSGCSALKEVILPNLRSIGMNGWNGVPTTKRLVFPQLKWIDNYAGVFGASLEYLDFASPSDGVLTIKTNTNFGGNVNLDTIIIRSGSVASLASAAFGATPIAKGTGYIYVPRSLVDSYKVATNWSTYANQFRAIEDYTVDGTITGETCIYKVFYGLFDINSSNTEAHTGKTYRTTLTCDNQSAIKDVTIISGDTDITDSVYNADIGEVNILNATDDLQVWAFIKETDTAMLYDFGDECSDITGGWGNIGYSKGAESKYEKTSTYMSISTVGASTSTISSANPITFNAGQTLHVCCDAVRSQWNSNLRIMLTSKCENANNENAAFGSRTDIINPAASTNITGGMLEYTFTEDMTGHIAFLADSWNANLGKASIKIHRIWVD